MRKTNDFMTLIEKKAEAVDFNIRDVLIFAGIVLFFIAFFFVFKFVWSYIKTYVLKSKENVETYETEI